MFNQQLIKQFNQVSLRYILQADRFLLNKDLKPPNFHKAIARSLLTLDLNSWATLTSIEVHRIIIKKKLVSSLIISNL